MGTLLLTLSAGVLGGAVALGLALAAILVRSEGRSRAGKPLGAVHGAAGLIGFGLLIASLSRDTSGRALRGVASGTASFGLIAAVLLAIALLAAGVIVTQRLRHRAVPVLVVAVHATIAITGFVILLAYVSVPN